LIGQHLDRNLGLAQEGEELFALHRREFIVRLGLRLLRIDPRDIAVRQEMGNQVVGDLDRPVRTG